MPVLKTNTKQKISHLPLVQNTYVFRSSKFGLNEVDSFLKQCFARSSIDHNWVVPSAGFQLTSADISRRYRPIASIEDRRGQYSFKKSIIVPGCLKKFSNSTQLSKVLFFIAKNFTGSIDRKD